MGYMLLMYIYIHKVALKLNSENLALINITSSCEQPLKNSGN